MKFGKAVVKSRIAILIISAVLLVPSLLGMINTRVNYDMLNYLPDSLDTVKGQEYMLEDFGKGAFSFLIFENVNEKDIVKTEEKIKKIDHVATVLWFDDVADSKIPMQALPDEVYDAFNKGDSTLMAVFFDSSSSSDETMNAISEIRKVAGEQCLVSGISAMVTDLRELCEREETLYVAIAVVLAVIAMIVFLDNWIIPFVFLASIGVAILFNLGSNIFLGEISYITKALSAVLQLAVTMDYSIFLWHSYGEQKQKCSDNKEAMAVAIKETVSSVLGSSITTVAGFIALCFMTFTLGRDLGIVMAKGVLLGVLSCVTVLPSMILALDKPLNKTMHRSLIPSTKKLAKGIVKIFPVFLIIFALIAVPSYYGYSQTNKEVYYDLSRSLPEDMSNVIANTKLKEEFGMGNTHMVLVNSKLDSKDIRKMNDEFKKVDGIKMALGLESVVGPMIPEEMLPESVSTVFKSDRWEMIILSSEYKTATDEMGTQITKLNEIIKKYDPDGLLVGEAACTNDLINITSVDFATVNAISIIAIFIIIMIVEKSISLPVILVAVIELAIFINLGLPHYLGESLPFIAPICISTIQLGATVDYAILMTTRYKKERSLGNDKRTAVCTALETSIPSIIVSAMGLFAATVGVAIYSDVDMIASLCALMARGALISMLCVILILPAMFMLFDKVIGVTTIGFRPKKDKKA
ncbi:efflux RND transporter permease subunit [Ruminococcus sp. JL13D9]|uniref:efflux RND transporter permease subunit n=1 Tax=Ruminococcus sp. JL13D9 TaxID=3233381 RepID=UPI00389A53EE